MSEHEDGDSRADDRVRILDAVRQAVAASEAQEASERGGGDAADAAAARPRTTFHLADGYVLC